MLLMLLMRLVLVLILTTFRYMEDEYLANLLSQKAGSKMKAVYVDTRRQLKMAREARAGGFCKEVRTTALPNRVCVVPLLLLMNCHLAENTKKRQQQWTTVHQSSSDANTFPNTKKNKI